MGMGTWRGWDESPIFWLLRVTETIVMETSRLNTLRLSQNGRHFPNNIFKCIFLNENVLIWIKISLKFVPKGQINDIAVLV